MPNSYFSVCLEDTQVSDAEVAIKHRSQIISQVPDWLNV